MTNDGWYNRNDWLHNKQTRWGIKLQNGINQEKEKKRRKKTCVWFLFYI